VTVVLFVISLAALERSPGVRSILLSLALGLFSLKNLTLTYFYLVDDLPDIHPLMFADAIVTAVILLRLLVFPSSPISPETPLSPSPGTPTSPSSGAPTSPSPQEKENEGD